jgi:hypothetical protein
MQPSRCFLQRSQAEPPLLQPQNAIGVPATRGRSSPKPGEQIYKAAAPLHSLARNHALLEGNQRSGLAAVSPSRASTAAA